MTDQAGARGFGEQEPVGPARSERRQGPDRDEGQLELQESDTTVFPRPNREQQRTGEQGKGQPARRNGREHPHHRFARDAAPHPEKPQIERDDGPDQQGDREDVRGVDCGIEPTRSPQSLRQGRPLERREQGLQGLSRARGKG